MDIKVTLPGGDKVNAEIENHIIETDQKPESGGQSSAPEPYMLFLVSIATCAGIYVKRFCDFRKISSEGIQIFQRHEFGTTKKGLSKVTIDIQVPPDFPEKYYAALIRSADKCSVKRTIFDPPEFEISTSVK